jgi:putative ABC transport system substrate-binding protein
MVSDPVASGVVASLARPGGNATGTSNMLPETSHKLLELLREVVPAMSRVAVLYSLANPGKLLEVRVLENEAARAGVGLVRLPVRTSEDLPAIFAEMPRHKVDGVVVLHDQVTGSSPTRIVESLARLALPAIYQVADFPEAGGLMSYGVNVAAQYRRTAVYVDRILRGAKPGDLPVEQPTKFDFVVNLRTAKALGIAVPPSVVARASKTI